MVIFYTIAMLVCQKVLALIYRMNGNRQATASQPEARGSSFFRMASIRSFQLVLDGSFGR